MIGTVLLILGMWMAFSTLTVVVLAMAARHGEWDERADLDAELQILIEQTRE